MSAVASANPNNKKRTADKIALENLFDDVVQETNVANGGRTMTLEEFGDLSNPWVMLSFYRRLFPWKLLFQWLNQDHIPSRLFTHREFSSVLAGDIFIRHQSFANAEELRSRIISQNAIRFEIGPVYNGNPKHHKTLVKSAFKPVLRELVFDIDMTDYDAIRTCCQGKAICKRCWKFIAIAVKVLDRALREDFGFKHLLWVFSGRRGIHVWISDAAAMSLTDEQRRAIVNYLEVIKGGAKQDKKVNLPRPLHPSLESMMGELRKMFGEVVLKDQECFKSEEQWETLLKLVPDRVVCDALRKKWSSEPEKDSYSRWKDLQAAAGKAASNEKVAKRMQDALLDIVIQYTYPRLDAAVSQHMNHLLKSPFVVHPDTGNVCIPLDPATIHNFDPKVVVTVGSLLQELELSASGPDFAANVLNAGIDSVGWEKTSLKPYVEYFKRHCDGIMNEAKALKRAEVAVKMEF